MAVRLGAASRGSGSTGALFWCVMVPTGVADKRGPVGLGPSLLPNRSPPGCAGGGRLPAEWGDRKLVGVLLGYPLLPGCGSCCCGCCCMPAGIAPTA